MSMGKTHKTLRYRYTEHKKVMRWLSEHANLSNNAEDIEYEDSEDGEGTFIKANVPIDDIIY